MQRIVFNFISASVLCKFFCILNKVPQIDYFYTTGLNKVEQFLTLKRLFLQIVIIGFPRLFAWEFHYIYLYNLKLK